MHNLLTILVTNKGGGFKYGKNKRDAAQERRRLFKIIEELVKWENITDNEVLEKARNEIRRSWREVCELNKDLPQANELFNPENLPALHDPFAGGGAIPLEAKRLGLEVFASDLNPVAVLINKAMIEVPLKFVGRQPIGPLQQNNNGEQLVLMKEWNGVSGLAEDIRRYGTWICKEARKRIGHLYPQIEVTKEMTQERPDLEQFVGQKLTAIAWIWARTVKSPNPAFSHVDVPLVSSFILSNKAGKEAYIEPTVDADGYSFKVKIGKPSNIDLLKQGTKLARGANFRCLVSDVPIPSDYIKSEGNAGRMGVRLMAIVAEGNRERIYLPPSLEIEDSAQKVKPSWKPETKLPDDPRNFWTVPYGLTHYSDLFTLRQLAVLSALSDLAVEVREKIIRDALGSGWLDDINGIDAGGVGAKAYAEAISLYLSLGISQLLRYCCSICSWNRTNENIVQAFGRQAVPMVWDFAESHPLHGSLSIEATIGWIASAIGSMPSEPSGFSENEDAQLQSISVNKFISTDPPYYDNIGYADLSDFFYVWLRNSLRPIFPKLLATITTPKEEELIATPYRHGSKKKAEAFFLEGMTKAMHRLSRQSHPGAPITIYYAFKQSETEADSGTASTGWVTFLSAVLQSGFQITGTWPMRTEKVDALKKQSNALASSIVLVCRKRPENAATISRREFIRELNAILPEALDEMTKGSGDDRSPVAPVDLSQAIIGPGMAVFSKYAAVLEADGSSMNVRTALQLINRFLAEDDFDPDTQFCLHWFEQYGWNEGRFGEADTLSRAKGTSVDGIRNAGVLESGGGIVRLLKWSEYPADWDPRTDKRMPIWESLHQLIRALKQGGETEAGHLLSVIKNQGEAIRQLAYRLYTLCERKGWAEDARSYNELITSWSGIEAASGKVPEAPARPIQETSTFDGEL